MPSNMIELLTFSSKEKFQYIPIYSALGEYWHFRYSQNVTIDNVQDEFVLEIPIKGNISCSGVVFGLRRFAASCGSMYFKESDCKMLETLPNEESCYVRCHCNNTCDGNLIMNVERDEQQWTLCPMSIAWNSQIDLCDQSHGISWYDMELEMTLW